MTRNNADFRGGHIDFDTWHGKAFRIVTTPSGRATDDKGNVLPDDPNRWSIVTPENGDAWNWATAPKKHIRQAKKNWSKFLQDPDAQYKVDQIRRSMLYSN